MPLFLRLAARFTAHRTEQEQHLRALEEALDCQTTRSDTLEQGLHKAALIEQALRSDLAHLQSERDKALEDLGLSRLRERMLAQRLAALPRPDRLATLAANYTDAEIAEACHRLRQDLHPAGAL